MTTVNNMEMTEDSAVVPICSTSFHPDVRLSKKVNA